MLSFPSWGSPAWVLDTLKFCSCVCTSRECDNPGLGPAQCMGTLL